MKMLLTLLLFLSISFAAYAEWFNVNHPDTANIVVIGNRGDTLFTFQKDRSLFISISLGTSWSNIKHTDITNVEGIVITREGNISLSISPMAIIIETSTDCGETFTDNYVWTEDSYNSNKLTKINSRYMGISATFDWAHVSFNSKDGLNFLSIPYYMGYYIVFHNYNFIYSRRDSLFITNDTNKTYSLLENPGISELGLCEENSKGKLYMLVKDTLFTSIDSGWTWQRMNLNLNGLLYLNIDNQDNIYLRTPAKIFCSYDDALSWTDITENLALTTCKYQELRFSDSKIFTRADDGNIYYRDIYTSVADNSDENELSISPNPVNDFIQIKYKANELYPTLIGIYSSMGEKVMETEYKESIDASELSPGIYFCKLLTGNYFLIKKFVLLR
ncbi:MAG: T9SS type A sorting domain-containing protein [Bacteroidetes bacterium]|nr:MAG: T9SS type A sorting domain-containing protein [Bacteroidota bacterium]